MSGKPHGPLHVRVERALHRVEKAKKAQAIANAAYSAAFQDLCHAQSELKANPCGHYHNHERKS